MEAKPKPMSEERLAEIEALILKHDAAEKDSPEQNAEKFRIELYAVYYTRSLLTEVRRLRAELQRYHDLAKRAHELEERRELTDYMNADAIVEQLVKLYKEHEPCHTD